MGDFNFPELKWKIPESLDDSHPFLKCINDSFLIQHVDEPTRENNILDLVLTSEENIIENLSAGERFGSSDHQIIRWNMVGSRNILNPINNFNYSKGDYNSMRREAGLINWNELIIGNDFEADWSRLKIFFEKMKILFVPLKNSKIKLIKN